MEFDRSVAGLQKLQQSLGIELTPGELQSTIAPQTRAVPGKEFAHELTRTAQLRPIEYSDLEIVSGSHSSRKSKRSLPLLVAAIVIGVAVLAFAIPLALELKKHSKLSSSISPSSTIGAPNKLPTSGAFNGTGLAVIALDQSDIPAISLFYQDNNSQIRRLYSKELSRFMSGFPIVTSNARNATPLTALTYPTSTGASNSHLYYIDINNTLQELYSTDNCITWQPGSLGDYNFTASASSTALTTFYSNQWLGRDENSTGIRLYYGAPDDHIHELALFPKSSHSPSQYFSQFVFPGSDGNAGITSKWSDDSGLGNLYLFGQNSEFQIWSNNFNTTHNATTNASYGNWVNDLGQTYYSINADTALAATNTLSMLCFQEEISGIMCSPTGSDGSLEPPSTSHPVTGSQNPQQGSALVAWWQATPGGFPWELNIFYQIENGDIIQNTDAAGTWVNSTVPAR